MIENNQENQIFKFENEPTFAELWDKCVYNLLYNIEKYKRDIEQLFAKLNITKKSDIVDVSVGGGFLSLDLLKDGYNIVCADGFQDEVELFNEKSQKLGLEIKCLNSRWGGLERNLSDRTFDFLFCRGNSFIYAGGGWNEMIEIKQEESLSNYKQTLAIFYRLLKPGGWIYVDKFKDSETTHKEKVCDIQVGDNPKEGLIFWTQRFPEKKIRQASMIRKKGENEQCVPNITYDLSSSELESMLAEAGFQNIQKVELASENNFDAWIAQK